MVRTWERSTFQRVCVAVLDRFSANTTLEATVLGKILAAGLNAAVVSLHGGPHVLAEAFANYLGSGYQTKLIEYPTLDLRLMKRCLQRTASFVFGSLDPVSLTEFLCEPFERSRNSRLDGFSSSFAQGHHHPRFVDARARQRGCEHCWGMTLDRVIPQRDWPQRRRR